MRGKNRTLSWILTVAAVLVPVVALSQATIERLAVHGFPGSIPVRQIDGHNYVQVEALVQLVSGTLSFRGNQITVTLPTAGEAEAAAKAQKTLSGGFVRAAIEELSTIREWHSALATAIENQYPVTPVVLGPYENRAATSLRLAQAAATSDEDHQATEAIANHFEQMKALSDKYLAERSAANYINAAALSGDPLDQSVRACSHALGTMLASRHFSEPSACR